MKVCSAPAGSARDLRIALGLSAAVFLFFGALYACLGMALAHTRAFHEYDVLFNIDTPRVIGDMTDPEADHHRAKTHPFYVLLVNPAGSSLRALLRSPVRAAVLVNTVFGALGVALAFVFFLMFTGSRVNALLLAAVFGFSMSQLVFGSVPDTASLAVCSVVATHIVALRCSLGRRVPWIGWVLAGVFTMGVTAVNVVQTGLCYAVSRIAAARRDGTARGEALRVFGFVLAVITITTGLAMVQRAVYPSSDLFFRPESGAEVLDNAGLEVVRRPGLVLKRVVQHFFLVTAVGPKPRAFHLEHRASPATTFATAWAWLGVGWAAMLLWLGLLVAGIVRSFVSKQTRSAFLASLSLCVAFNMLFHCFYGTRERAFIELFVYSGNYTFLMVSFLAVHGRSKRWTMTLVLATLSVLMAWNNLLVLHRIWEIYS